MNDKIKISLVMAVYNGKKYLLEQLDSLKNQTKKIDEVIIIDDCSKDNSINIINNYIKENRLNWILIENSINLGWKSNFQKGLVRSTGDLIFLCDQDDIWYDTKVERMVDVMSKHSDISLLACSYEPLYEDKITKRISKRIINTMKDDDTIRKIPLNSNFISVERPGCSYCLKKELVNEAKKYWDKTTPHDAVLWRIAILQNKAYLYDKKLMYWRRYSVSNSNPLRLTNDFSNSVILERNNMLRNVIIPDCKFLDTISGSNNFKDEKIIGITKRIFENRKNFYLKGSILLYLKLIVLAITSGYSIRAIIHDGIIVFKYKYRKGKLVNEENN